MEEIKNIPPKNEIPQFSELTEKERLISEKVEGIIAGNKEATLELLSAEDLSIDFKKERAGDLRLIREDVADTLKDLKGAKADTYYYQDYLKEAA